MYNSYKDGVLVNSISELTYSHIKFELAAGRIFSTGEFTQDDVNAAYDEVRRVIYSIEVDPMYIKSDPLITSETGISRVDWRNARNQVKTDYQAPTI